MSTPQLHEALDQVRQLQDICLSRQRMGYSGRARVTSGVVCLAGAGMMASSRVPATAEAHLLGWMIVLAVAVVLNYISLAYWFLNDPTVNREAYRLKPAAEAAAPLLLGGLFSAVLISKGMHALSFGVCMCMFGLANIASRHLVHRLTGLVGIYYVVCGIGCLFISLEFTNPWPMGLVFGGGEIIAGCILHYDDRRRKREST